MTRPAPIANWVMNIATRNPPANRKDWASAMRAEFDALETGRIGWAVGCLTVMAGSRLQAGWPYLALMVIGVVVVMFQGFLTFWMPFNILSTHAPDLLGNLLVCAALGFYRPDRTWTTALCIGLINQLISLVVLYLVMHAPLGRPLHIADAPPAVGFCALVGVCVIGAQIGGAIGRRRGRSPSLA